MTPAVMRLVVLALVLLATPAFAEPVEVTAKVVEMPKKMIYCGVIAYRAVVRYEVITVDKGAYTPKEIFAVELCPERLKVGAKRRLRLLKPAVAGNFHDEFQQRPGTRWAIAHR